MSIFDKASALFATHRTAVLAGGGAGVVGLAVISRKRKKNSSVANGGAGGGGADGNAAPSQIGAPADPYSSVAYDVYDALQPQLEQGLSQLQSEIDALSTKQKHTKKAKAKKKPAPAHHRRKTPRKSPRKPIRRKRRPVVFGAGVTQSGTANSSTGRIY